METISNNTKGIYSLTYGYASHTINFISTRDEFEKFRECEINIETAKHSYEDVSLSDVVLITEDEEFVNKFELLKLSDFNPFEYCEEEE